MKRLAIISSYNESCGNASYTHVLKNGFSRYVEVDVIPLDLFLLQSSGKMLRRAGDRHIQEICEKIKAYDYVNIQFEAGLFGKRVSDMYGRVRKIIDAAPNITITMHRVEAETDTLASAVKAGFIAKRYKRFKQRRGAGIHAKMTSELVRYCRSQAERKNVVIKVHTRRDRRMVEQAFNNPNVYDYPIVFLNEEERSAAWQHADRTRFLAKHDFAPGDKVVGLFGFLSSYKGVDTAIRALSLLPDNYKLGLFGSQHPQSVKRNETVDPYLDELFELMEDIDSSNYIARTVRDLNGDENDKPGDIVNQMVSRFIEISGRVESTVPVGNRVRFIGGLPDPEFIEALRLCDAVVLPYLETGQGMSGVIVLSLEAGAKMICSNNHSFRETSRYFRDCYMNFDIGNHHELAQKIEWVIRNGDIAECKVSRDQAFERYNIDASVRLQLEKFGHHFNS